MKTKQPRKARNLMAKALHECKIFAPKAIAPKKGKGSIYKRDRKGDLSGPSFLPIFYAFAPAGRSI
jgi:stalled ribosome alternative rescue factor ArfA